ncbi:unnamed protein product [Darwinula stevensoni]|uniref:RCC1-like domain-containing protein n=1 Tax=Darwinula stevensoni TaxID=69355 RepID=A0A7R9A2V5_9CRUS|nr:unnamed protein product [Darwinula stevensoni]CAG0890482.1 unnamed protein product [Darwinula stevensoni]
MKARDSITWYGMCLHFTKKEPKMYDNNVPEFPCATGSPSFSSETQCTVACFDDLTVCFFSDLDNEGKKKGTEKPEQEGSNGSSGRAPTARLKHGLSNNVSAQHGKEILPRKSATSRSLKKQTVKSSKQATVHCVSEENDGEPVADGNDGFSKEEVNTASRVPPRRKAPPARQKHALLNNADTKDGDEISSVSSTTKPLKKQPVTSIQKQENEGAKEEGNKETSHKTQPTRSQRGLPSSASPHGANKITQPGPTTSEPLKKEAAVKSSKPPSTAVSAASRTQKRLAAKEDSEPVPVVKKKARQRPEAVPSDYPITILPQLEGIFLEVYTFGCNDEGALGRRTEEEEESFEPKTVPLPFAPKKCILVTAGDSHTAVLTSDFCVYAWGTFRDLHGPLGLLPSGIGGIVHKAELIYAAEPVKKIASGEHHLVILTVNGGVLSVGSPDQGQLGRVPRQRLDRGGRLGPRDLLEPQAMKLPSSFGQIVNIWAGGMGNILKDGRGVIYACGLNNHGQLGLPLVDEKRVILMPEKSIGLADKKWKEFALGQHHTIALDMDGKVHSLGRGHDGRLGLGEVTGESVYLPQCVPALAQIHCVSIHAGESVSFTITDDGVVYGWGFGENLQLGTKEGKDAYEPVMITTKDGAPFHANTVAVGSQHVAFLSQQ